MVKITPTLILKVNKDIKDGLDGQTIRDKNGISKAHFRIICKKLKIKNPFIGRKGHLKKPIQPVVPPQPETPKEPVQPTQPIEPEKPLESVKPDTGDSDLDSFYSDMNKYNEGQEDRKEHDQTDTNNGVDNPPVNNPPVNNPPVSNYEKQRDQLITGYLFLVAINAIFPDVILALFKKVNKDPRLTQISGEQVELSDEQILLVEPIADEFVKIHLPKLNPLTLLIIVMGALYFRNIKRALKEIPKEPVKDITEKKKDKPKKKKK